MIDLLIECNFKDKANWLQYRLNILKQNNEGEKDFHIAVVEIKSVLAGMGSFMDLPLVPKKGSKLTEDKVRELQWDLVKEFDESTIGIISDEKHA